MNRRQWMMLSGAAVTMSPGAAQGGQSTEETPDKLLLKDYRPESIYRIPKTEVKKARYPIIDAHCHGAGPAEQVKDMVKIMDTVGVERTVIFTGAIRPEQFAGVSWPYSQYPERFDLWCGFDLTNSDQPGFGPDAVRALEECHRLGARGVGEISDKGKGFGGRAATGPHADDPRMDPLFDKCAYLGMPINIHVSDPIWAYEPMDKTNDGLPNGYKWRIAVKPGILGHNELIETLERAVQKHPKTVFIACHLANLGYDLTRLGHMFDRHSNLYADISARFGEIAPIPRFTAEFFGKYPDRVLYGTDMAYSQRMFSSTFRIMETLDEHFYEFDLDVCYDYHWPLHGLGLPDVLLKKVYRENALLAFQRAQANAG